MAASMIDPSAIPLNKRVGVPIDTTQATVANVAVQPLGPVQVPPAAAPIPASNADNDQSSIDMIAADQKTSSSPWAPFEAGGYSAANSALLGIPDMIIKAVSSPAYADLKKLQAEHPLASTVGDVAGMFVPGLGELGVAGKAVEGAKALSGAAKLGPVSEALDKLLNVAKGGEGVTRLQQGLAQGIIQSVPRAISSGITTGDWSGAGSQALLGTATGGVASAVLGKIASKAPSIIQETAEDADKALVNGALDVNSTRAFRKILGNSASEPQIAAAYKRSADLIRQVAKDNQGLAGIKPVLKDLVNDTGDTWKSFARNFDAANPQIGNEAGMAQLNQNPVIQEFVQTFGDDGANALRNMVEQVDRSPSFVSKRSLLDTYANAGFKSDDPMKQYLGSAARAIKGQIDDAAMALTPDADLGQMKQVYSALLPIKKMLQQAAVKGGQPFSEGSQTFVRTATKAAMDAASDKGASSLLMGAINPAVGAAQIGGDVIGKIAPMLANKTAAKAGEVLGPALRSEVAGNVAESLAANANKIGGAAAKTAAGIAEGNADVNASDQSSKASSDIVGQALTSEEASVAASNPEAARSVSLESTAPVGAATAAKQQINNRYAATIQQRLVDQYNKYFRNYMTLDQFAQQVAQTTNNFDPKFSARFLFDDATDQTNFLKAYNASLQKQTIDINGALQHASAGAGVLPVGETIGALVRNPKVVRNQKAYSDLLDMLENTSGKSRKDIDNTLMQIARQPGPLLEKRRMLDNTMKYSLGYNTEMLEKIGLRG